MPNIEPGTRVRSVEDNLNVEGGTYLRFEGGYHVIHWDSSRENWEDWHTEDEFEVI